MLVWAVLSSVAAVSLSKPLTGGLRDDHECLLSAGYSYCESKSKCLRPWEEKCPGGCSKLITSLCGESEGDVKSALDCMRVHDESLKSAGCAFPDEATKVLRLAVDEPTVFAKLLQESQFAAVIDSSNLKATPDASFAILQDSSKLPTVFAHGMGDSCFNSGMKQITADTGKHIGSYSVCVPTGDNVISDTINGFLMNMDKSVDVFAEKIRKDPNLQGGFNAVGFSQGNSLIRGYIHKYNNPPVRNVLHVHGTISGVSGFPQCNPAGNSLCKGISQLCGELAYNSIVQGILFQADYFRDPRLVNSSAYLEHSQLAAWNNEAGVPNTTYKSNFASVEKFVLVKAMGDTMVFPNEGEWFGHFADGDSYTPIPMNETRWYREDLFGLKTVSDAGKIHLESTPGNHLQFTEEELFGWVDKYF